MIKARPCFNVSYLVATLSLSLSLISLAGGADAAAADDAANWQIFRFERLNRAYVNEAAEIAPIETGGIVIHLESPQNELILKANTVRLQRLADGNHNAFVEIAFEGSGVLEGKLVFAGGSTDLQDRVVAPLQTIRLTGRVAIARDEGGYRITTLELPDSVTVEIHTGMIDSLLSFCRPLALFTGLNCDVMTRALSNAELPLPGPGTELFLPNSDLTEEDRERLDRYLG